MPHPGHDRSCIRGRYPGSQGRRRNRRDASPSQAEAQWRVDARHLLTVAGAAQALRAELAHLLPVQPSAGMALGTSNAGSAKAEQPRTIPPGGRRPKPAEGCDRWEYRTKIRGSGDPAAMRPSVTRGLRFNVTIAAGSPLPPKPQALPPKPEALHPRPQARPHIRSMSISASRQSASRSRLASRSAERSSGCACSSPAQASSAAQASGASNRPCT